MLRNCSPHASACAARPWAQPLKIYRPYSSPPPMDPPRVAAESEPDQGKNNKTRNYQTTKKTNQKKNQKKKKNIFSKTMGWGLQRWFFGFLVKKKGFFGSKPSFSREKDGFASRRPPKTFVFSRTNGFSKVGCSKPSFSREKDGFSKDGCSKPSFSREKDGFSKDGCSKPPFSREKDGFEPKNHLFLEKTKKKTKKKTSFGGPSPIVLEKIVFFFCFFFFFVFLVSSRKRWFFGSKPSFPREKMVLPVEDLQKPSFSRWFFEGWLLKTIFFSRKGWFRTKKSSFLKKTKKTQKNKKTQTKQTKKKKKHLLEAPAP